MADVSNETELPDGMEGVERLVNMIRRQGYDLGVQIGQEQVQVDIQRRVADAVAAAESEWAERQRIAVNDAFFRGEQVGAERIERALDPKLEDAYNRGSTDALAQAEQRHAQLLRTAVDHAYGRGETSGAAKAQGEFELRLDEVRDELEAGWAQRHQREMDAAFQDGEQSGVAKVRQGRQAELAEAEERGYRRGTTDTMTALQQAAQESWDAGSMSGETPKDKPPQPLFLAADEGPNAYVPVSEVSLTDSVDLTLTDIRELGERAHWLKPVPPEVASMTMKQAGVRYYVYRPLKGHGITIDTTIEAFFDKISLAELVRLDFLSYGIWGEIRRVFGTYIIIEANATS